MALHDGVDVGKEGEGNESLGRVKITRFVDGGVAIAAKFVHPIADAQNLADFLHYWAKVHRELAEGKTLNGIAEEISTIKINEDSRKEENGETNGTTEKATEPETNGATENHTNGVTEQHTNGSIKGTAKKESKSTSVLPEDFKPYLDPDQFMAYAAGDINAPTPDSSLIKASRSLPIHRYDWWASTNGCPPPFLWRTQTAPEILASGIEFPPLSNPIPWSDLDVLSPISSYNLQFSPQEIENMYKEASKDSESGSLRVSRLDALLAHIWTLIIRARNLPGDDEVFLNMIVNFRAKLEPPLPTSFIGTPAILAYAKSTASNTSTSSSQTSGFASLAQALRSTVSSFTPSTIPNFLHDAAHGIETKRFWQTFIGKHHVTATSWLHHGLYDVDFGSGSRLRYAEPVMPPYLVCVTEGEGERKEGGKWYERGATVSIHFETRVVDRLLQDPGLRRFDY